MYVRIRHRPSTIIDNETVTIQYNPHPMRRGGRRGLATILSGVRPHRYGRRACMHVHYSSNVAAGGKVFVLSGELDGDRITLCCKASYSTEEKLLLCLSHNYDGEGRERVNLPTRTHLQSNTF